jgi:hypothetical protein
MARTKFAEDPHQYIQALRREHDEFDRKDMLARREALNERRGQIEEELTELLDKELDRRADAAPDGLLDALDFLAVTRDADVPLQQNVLGDEPQNFVTEYRAAKAALDQRLGVEVDRQATLDLLEQIHDLRTQLRGLERDLRLLPPAPDDAGGEGAAPAAPPRPPEDSAGGGEGEAGATRPQDDVRALLARELEETGARLQAVTGEYRHSVNAVERAADRARPEARRRVEEGKSEAVVNAEEELVQVDEKLRRARQALEDLQQERRRFFNRHLAYLVISFLLVYGLPLALSIGIELARDLVAFLWENFWNVALWTLVVVAVYAAVVAIIYWRTLHGQLTEAADLVNRLALERRGAADRLHDAHNAELKLAYDLIEQDTYVELYFRLLKAAEEREEGLRQKLEKLRATAEEFDQRWAAAVPESSTMRRPLLTAEDTDAYYGRAVPSAEAEAEAFGVKRSQSRTMKTEELRDRLTRYAEGRFESLSRLTVEEALLRKHDLVPQQTAQARLRELSDAGEPLVYLHATDISTEKFAQRNTTIWASAEEHDLILERYGRIAVGNVSARASERGDSLRVLTRCIYFPAYYLSAIEHYRECYERLGEKDALELPHPVPEDAEVKRAYENLLLALALGIVIRRPGGDYALAGDGGKVLGGDRRRIAEELATSFSQRTLYSELAASVKRQSDDTGAVRQRLLELAKSDLDFDEAEHARLAALIQKYHPLR